MKTLNYFWHFVRGSLSVVSRGTRAYYAWIALLVVVILIGVSAYMNQASTGLITTNMRDPLSWVPVKYKLPLTFLSICLVAFGVGGVVVTSTAREALEEQIRLRLDERATATNLIIDRHLDLIGRRIEDFASDGFIRTELAAGGSPRLRRHLIENKLPLVASFVDACVVDAAGEPVLFAHHE